VSYQVVGISSDRFLLRKCLVERGIFVMIIGFSN